MADINREIQQIRKNMDKLAVKKVKTLLKEYRKALDSVTSDINNIYAKYTVNGELNISTAQRYAVLKQLEQKLVKLMRELGDKDVEVTTTILENVYTEAFYQTAYTIDKGVDIAIDFSILKKEFIENAINMPIKGEMFSSRIWKNKTKLVNRIRRDVIDAMVKGTSVDKLSRRIQKDFGSSSYESTRLITNEVARCTTQAQSQIYRESGVVREVLFDATLDNRTSDICQSLDGKRFPVNNHPLIPQDTHINCRSCIIPIVNGWNPTKKRDNITKQNINYKTYNQWKASRGID